MSKTTIRRMRAQRPEDTWTREELTDATLQRTEEPDAILRVCTYCGAQPNEVCFDAFGVVARWTHMERDGPVVTRPIPSKEDP